LLQLLVTLFMRFVVSPDRESLWTQGTGNGTAAAEVLAVLVGPEVGALRVGAAQRTRRIRRV